MDLRCASLGGVQSSCLTEGGGGEVIWDTVTSLGSTDRIIGNNPEPAIVVLAHNQGRNETAGYLSVRIPDDRERQRRTQ